MTRGCSTDLLERWVVGELDGEAAATARAHAAACKACARELAWLRAERRAFGDRAQHDGSRPPDFEAVMRSARDRSGVLARFAVAVLPERRLVAFAACAAAALFFAVRIRPSEIPPARTFDAPPRPAEHRAVADSDALCTFDASEDVSSGRSSCGRNVSCQIAPEDAPRQQGDERECSEPEVGFTPLASTCESPSL